MTALTAPDLQRRLRQALHRAHAAAPGRGRRAAAPAHAHDGRAGAARRTRAAARHRAGHGCGPAYAVGPHPQLPDIARATVYAVLQLFVARGLLKELPIDGAATVYDSNTGAHHHLYNLDTGEISDLPAEALQVLGLPALQPGLELAGVDVVLRVRGRPAGP